MNLRPTFEMTMKVQVVYEPQIIFHSFLKYNIVDAQNVGDGYLFTFHQPPPVQYNQHKMEIQDYFIDQKHRTYLIKGFQADEME
jgi:hypothetical protein